MNILDFLYYTIPSKNKLLRTIRFSVRVIYNLYCNIYYSTYFLFKNKYVFEEKQFIVSLTSFPDRINKLWLVIASLLHQDCSNKFVVVLYLSNEQFDGLNSLPRKLLLLQKSGLIIKFVNDDLKPHKKYFYAFQEYPNKIVITVDDDILYNKYLISNLINWHKRYPYAVVCNRSVTIKKGEPYSNWAPTVGSKILVSNILPTGIGGVLYPPHCYNNQIFNKEVIKQTCLYGDDLWLNFMYRIKGTKIIQTGFQTGLITLLSSQKVALCHLNISANRNDKQLFAISKWSTNALGVDFFVNIK